MWVHMQEEEDADYKQRFPDYHADFDDILDPQGDLMEEDSSASQAQHEASNQRCATQAQTSSASTKDLMQGQLLDDIVALHARYSHRCALGSQPSRTSSSCGASRP